MKISVVIPMYNSEETIKDALDSVINQTFFHCILEIVVVDDGSKDKSVDIVQEYIQRHKDISINLIQKSNGGASSARNVGIENAKGDWIALLDSDDEWLPHKTERQVLTIQENPEIDFLGCGYDNVELKILNKKVTNLYKASLKDLCLKMFPVTPSALFKKSIYNEIGGFDTNYKYAEDGNYFMKICSRYNYYYLPESLVSIGHGKRPYGEKGLSANMKGMYEGNVRTIKSLKKEKKISFLFYCFLRLFYFAKHVRRILIVKFR